MTKNSNSAYYSGNEEWIENESIITAEKMTNIENAFLNVKTDLKENIENSVNSYFKKIKNETPAFIKYYITTKGDTIRQAMGETVTYTNYVSVNLKEAEGYSCTNALSFSFDLTGFQSNAYIQNILNTVPPADDRGVLAQGVTIELYAPYDASNARNMTIFLETENSKINNKSAVINFGMSGINERGVQFYFSDEEMQTIINENPVFNVSFSGDYDYHNDGSITSIQAYYFKVDHYDLPEFSLESEVN